MTQLNMGDLTEKQVVEKIKKGEINFFEVLVKKYTKQVRLFVGQRVSDKADREDIIQNSFIKLYKSLDRFDSSRRIYPYLLTITSHEIAQFYRDNPRHSVIGEEHELEDHLGIEEGLNLDNLMSLSLRPDYKQALVLWVQGYSYKEISDKLAKPVNTVKTLLRRAKIELRKALEE